MFELVSFQVIQKQKVCYQKNVKCVHEPDLFVISKSDLKNNRSKNVSHLFHSSSKII